MKKYIFVTGGVVSGLGKGITAASLGRLLKARGLKVAAQKLDPYINVDPGTMSPYQHGEVYVTEDGAETDLDLGHYERFIDEDLNRYSNLTTGKVYANVLSRERQGGYLGKTVQTIPHVTDEIKRFIYRVGETSEADIVITEVGGTIGDIEGQPFLEAIRQVGREVGKDNTIYIHVTLVPYLRASGEHKSKPTQHSVKELQGMGITPDILVLRTDEPITDGGIFEKIAHFCNVDRDCVIENLTLDTLYEAPLYLEQAHFSDIVCKKLHLDVPAPDLTEWREMVDRVKHTKGCVTIALVGKYTQLHDARRVSFDRGGFEARGICTRHRGSDPVDRFRDVRTVDAFRCGRRTDPRRIRKPRHRGHDRSGALFENTYASVSRHLSRHADPVYRIRTLGARLDRRKLGRIRPGEYP